MEDHPSIEVFMGLKIELLKFRKYSNNVIKKG